MTSKLEIIDKIVILDIYGHPTNKVYSAKFLEEIKLFRKFKIKDDNGWKEFISEKTRISYDGKRGIVYKLRYPGATFGLIFCDENNIIEYISFKEDLIFGETWFPYDYGIVNLSEKYKGYKIIKRNEEIIFKSS
jgi:hypothetical protein